MYKPVYKGGVVHAKEKKILVMLVIRTEGTCPTDDYLSALKETERNGLTIGSQQKRSASGNDALAPAAAATSLEIDWGVVTFEGGVGGEDTDEGREGVHLGVLRGLSCRRGGCDGCEAAGESNCLHRQLIYRGMAHPRAYREPANDPGEASTSAWVAMMKASEGR